MRKTITAIVLAALLVGSMGGFALAQPMSAAEHQRLFIKGAQLWPLYCNTCHNARPGSEKAPYEWNAIILHMRMLGNIPADDQRALVEYLKAR